jgi:Leucine-rich repeat (LRR) protein
MEALFSLFSRRNRFGRRRVICRPTHQEGVFPPMVTKPKATVARRTQGRSGASKQTVMQCIATSFAVAALFALVGCEKIPTWSELVGGKKKDAAPAAPPVAKADTPKAEAPQPAPQAPEPPKKTAQEAIAQFSSTPTYRRTNAQLAELAALPEARDQITALELQGSSVDEAGFAELPKFDKVERLNISMMNYSSGALANVAKMKGVTAIAMWRGPQKEKNCDAGLAQLKPMKQLTELYIDQSKITPAGIAEIAQMTQLEKLSVAMVSAFTDEHLQMLAPLVNLKYLDLTNSLVTDDGLQHVTAFPELETLKIGKMHGVRGKGLLELGKKKALRNLHFLSIYDNPYMTIEAYMGISRLPSITILDVGSANCTNAAFEGAMPALKNLEVLSVHQNEHLNDEAILQALPKMRKLKSLYFQGNRLISDASMPAFAKCKTLEALTLLQTLCTEDACKKLKTKFLKNCKINLNGKMID